MGTTKKPRQDDQDNDGIPDDIPPQARANPDDDLDGDGNAEGQTRIQADPIIINR